MSIERVKEFELHIFGKLTQIQHSEIIKTIEEIELRELFESYHKALNDSLTLISKDIISLKNNDIVSNVEQHQEFKQIATDLWLKESDLEVFMNRLLQFPDRIPNSGNEIDTRFPSIVPTLVKFQDAVNKWDEFMKRIHFLKASRTPIRYFPNMVNFLEHSVQKYIDVQELMNQLSVNVYRNNQCAQNSIQFIGKFIAEKWFKVSSALTRDVNDMTIATESEADIAVTFNEYQDFSFRMEKCLIDIMMKFDSEEGFELELGEIIRLSIGWQEVEDQDMVSILRDL